MSEREWRAYIEDILHAIKDINSFTKGLSFKDFQSDRKVIYAVAMTLQIMGEAARRVPETIKQKRPEVK